jgi:hypothetical protein
VSHTEVLCNWCDEYLIRRWQFFKRQSISGF